jgi:ankyrin repeat protein
MEWDAKGWMTGNISSLNVVDAQGHSMSIELVSYSITNGQIKTKTFGIIKARSAGGFSAEYLIQDSQVRAIKKSLQELANGKHDSHVVAHPELGPALLQAASKGNLSEVQRLLASGADATFSDRQGITSLLFAANNGHEDVAVLLLEKGAHVDQAEREEGSTPLMQTAITGNTSIMKILLQHGANPNIRRYSDGDTALILAAENGKVSAVETLLAAKADPHIQDKSGATPLHYAVAVDNAEIAGILFKAGADPNVMDAKHVSPISLARANGRDSIVSLLTKSQAPQ